MSTEDLIQQAEEALRAGRAEEAVRLAREAAGRGAPAAHRGEGPTRSSRAGGAERERT